MSLSIDRDKETSHMLDTLNMLETFLRETLWDKKKRKNPGNHSKYESCINLVEFPKCLYCKTQQQSKWNRNCKIFFARPTFIRSENDRNN